MRIVLVHSKDASGLQVRFYQRPETRDIQTRRFIFVAKHWFRFLGKWRDPIRNPQFKSELDSFLEGLRDERGYTDQTLSTRETALNLFFDWLGKQGLSLKDVSPATIDAYFVQNKARADQGGIPLREVVTNVSLDRTRSDEVVFHYEVVLEGELTPDQERDLLRAAQACPVRRTLSKRISFEYGLGKSGK